MPPKTRQNVPRQPPYGENSTVKNTPATVAGTVRITLKTVKKAPKNPVIPAFFKLFHVEQLTVPRFFRQKPPVSPSQP